jgi:mannose-6-phosphate isomerase
VSVLGPLVFRPVYQTVVWGGRRIAQWRDDVPDGPIGESWDIADHPRGMSVVASGEYAGQTLRALMESNGQDIVGPSWDGGPFPLMVKLIDANDRLSVQVHPDDALAVELGVGDRGKTECWFMLGDGGELFQGTRPGIDRVAFERALASGTVVDTLNRYETRDGEFYFLPARTVHALGRGCLLYEVQQTCDVTFRVYDWGRMGLDGNPRETHVAESLRTIDFAAQSGPVLSSEQPHPQSGQARNLAVCAYFDVQERVGGLCIGGDRRACSVVICVAGEGELTTRGGSVLLRPMQTVVVPASSGEWLARGDGLRLLVSRPR